jgi:hypothetical protein
VAAVTVVVVLAVVVVVVVREVTAAREDSSCNGGEILLFRHMVKLLELVFVVTNAFNYVGLSTYPEAAAFHTIDPSSTRPHPARRLAL